MLTKAELEVFIEKLQNLAKKMQPDHKVCKHCWEIITAYRDMADRLRYVCYCDLD